MHKNADRPALESVARLQLIASVCRSAVLFAFQWMFARSYGPQIFGVANTAQAGLQVATMFGNAAGDTIVFRGMSHEPDSVRKAVVHGVTLSLFGGITSGLALIIWGVFVPGLSKVPAASASFFLVAASVPLAAVLLPLGAILRRERRFGAYALTITLLDPIVRFSILVVSALIGANWLWAMTGFPLGAALSAVVAIVLLRPVLSGQAVGITRGERSTLITFSTETTLATALQASMFFATLSVAGTIASAADVGRFAASARIVMLALWIQTAYATSFLPLIPRLLVGQEHNDELRALYGRVITTVLWVNAPLLTGLVAGSHGILALFGSQFAQGAVLLSILVVGQWVNSATALAEDFLPLSGHSRLALVNSFVALSFTIVGTYVLGQRIGIVGVAIAYSGATVILNLARAYQIRRLLQVSVPYRMVFTSAAAAIMVLAAWSRFVRHEPLRTQDSLLGGFICCLLTAGIMYVLSESSERQALRAFFRLGAASRGSTTE